ncbi:PIG-L family deacetylase [Nonlabens xiamenensis]|uniref:PIG-L family deacetylase n=1 Tax=Nonlabens xiamenensis TaxID=2341043 RepID=UPI001981E4C3|nr:PIG-L family deacetylase [Nonlabens xiamenensis]
MITKYFACWAFLFGHLAMCFAQENRLTPTPTQPSDIHHRIKQLGFLGSALYLAAHPDDENTRLISYLANDRMARTAYLSLTRGDGGQNLIGPQLREQLGMIRTQELLEARNIDNGQQFFTRANDFGYSKHPDETLDIWNEEEVTADVVRIIRRFKPDVVINRFDHRTPGSTHGHHTTSAMLSMKAFQLAGKTDAYKDQLETLEPWQPSRVFFNTSWWFYGGREAFAKADKTNLLEIDAGSYYTHKGLSNGEIAALSRSQHKSQGFGSIGSRGSQIEYLEFLEGSFPNDKTDLFSGINTTWSRVPKAEGIQAYLDRILAAYDFKDPAASLEALLELRKRLKSLPPHYWKEIKLKDLEELILDITGLYMEASIPQPQLVQGAESTAVLELTNRSQVPLKIRIMSTDYVTPETTSLTIQNNQSTNVELSIKTPTAILPSSPYYLKEKGSLGMYAVLDPTHIGQPELPAEIQVPIRIQIMDQQIDKTVALIHKRTDPVRGEVNEPLHIVPPVGVSIAEPVFVFSNNPTKTIQVKVKAYAQVAAGTVELCHPATWNVSPDLQNFEALAPGVERSFQFELTAPNEASRGVISGLVKIGDKSFSQEVISIDYDHIPDQQLVRNNSAQVVKPGLINKAETVAYINGAGDEVAQAIEAIGSKVFKFEPSEVPADLSKYDVVVTGIRAFNVAEEDMAALQDRLEAFVNQGGTLLMQYNTSRRFDQDLLGPLSITLSRKRVTDENAPVSILAPDHPILNTPNKISQEDFEGWVQERGLYFPTDWDPAFTPLLGMKDKGEEMTKGSLIVAPYGKGHVIYTGLSLFRELPAGVSGAYRLLANMLSVGIQNQPINTENGKSKL